MTNTPHLGIMSVYFVISRDEDAQQPATFKSNAVVIFPELSGFHVLVWIWSANWIDSISLMSQDYLTNISLFVAERQNASVSLYAMDLVYNQKLDWKMEAVNILDLQLLLCIICDVIQLKVDIKAYIDNFKKKDCCTLGC